MLVLTRMLNESVVIQTPAGDLIEVEVADIRGDKVRIGFTAPKDHKIMRHELKHLLKAKPEQCKPQKSNSSEMNSESHSIDSTPPATTCS